MSDSAKAAHYIEQLDNERCKGNWPSVPELARKVGKHAPQRKCLVTAARAEHQVALHDPSRPNTPSSTGLAGLIPSLLEAIEDEDEHEEDALQAQVCLAWVHWMLNEPGLASTRLPREFVQRIGRREGGVGNASHWTKVCAIKAIFIKGASLYKTLGPVEALDVFGFALPLLSQMDISGPGVEQRIWIERLLATSCQLANGLAADHNSTITDESALSFFRAWARFWEPKIGHGFKTDGLSPGSEIARRNVWKDYYETLSRALAQGKTYHFSGHASYSNFSNSDRLQQRAEVQRVQAFYEGLLLREVQFPKATEETPDFEQWSNLVIQNWTIMCGDTWYDQDLGEGGKEAVGRGVLDILYRAASKTFHSTTILRHLFTVHAALSEFYLSFKALDTYLDIASRGKARVAKSGESEFNLDSDDVVIETAAQGLRLLCQYGRRTEASRAREIAALIEGWLQVHFESQPSANRDSQHSAGNHGVWTALSPRAIGTAHWAIATSEAHWARLTYDASSRTELQNKAIERFKKALHPDFGITSNIELLFGFATLLAETRKISTAIEVVKKALGANTVGAQAKSSERAMFDTERRLLPLWHLLSLLLSARQDFQTAFKACDAAFQQFQSPDNLFGKSHDVEFTTPESTVENLPSNKPKGVILAMQSYEKAIILQLKMTQIALVEAGDGPEHAVNVCEELLTLYAKLFGEFKHKDTRIVEVPATPGPPKSSPGTLRSMSGSLFGRPRSTRKGPYKSELGSLVDEEEPSARPKTAASQSTTANSVIGAPTIQVTDEHGETPESQPRHHHPHLHLHRPGSSHSSKLQKSNSTAVRRQKSLSSFRRHKNSKSDPIVEEPERVYSPAPQLPLLDRNNFQDRSESQASGQVLKDYSPTPSQVGLAVSPDIPSPAPSPQPSHQHLRSAAETLAVASANPPKRNMIPPKSSQSHINANLIAAPPSPSRSPSPRFSLAEDNHQRMALLIKVWLLIATLYRRTQLFEDCRGAIHEATKIIEELEQGLLQDPNWSKLLDTPGWGCAKSISELWGDVMAERGHLCLAQSQPYEALAHYEDAVSRCIDHVSGTVGLCNLLLDISSGTLIPQSTTPVMRTHLAPTTLGASSDPPTPDPILSHMYVAQQQQNDVVSTLSSTKESPVPAPLGIPHPSTTAQSPSTTSQPSASNSTPNHSHPRPAAPQAPKKASRSSPEALDRLAARDRAYGLLSTLTKLGTGWDSSEAWFALARAYEESGQLDKAKEALWWCVELEDERPIRAWKESGGIQLIL
ncbi:MAG: hypothetical protein M1814_001526 [Vezdaea aestivalis]|nr:MAG: hypothetical protein M1814_001526 [Vezdaea aestivalis]